MQELPLKKPRSALTVLDAGRPGCHWRVLSMLELVGPLEDEELLGRQEAPGPRPRLLLLLFRGDDAAAAPAFLFLRSRSIPARDTGSRRVYENFIFDYSSCNPIDTGVRL